MQSLQRKILRSFKQLCYVARDLPDPRFGRREINKVKAWLRESPDNWNAHSFAHIRYQQKELEATIMLAKYRAMKRNYYD
mmetsp:Transcript_23804/g.38167  ORF Transcript_23804/g.38167 Transcript_23804/m.38167 type:complete len:80 (-) Transcript_23804:250-489(-)